MIRWKKDDIRDSNCMNQRIIKAINKSVVERNIQQVTLWIAQDDWRNYAKKYGASRNSIRLANLIEEEHPKLSSSTFRVGGSGVKINAMYLAKWLVLAASNFNAELAYSSLLELESSSDVNIYNLSLISGVDFKGKAELTDGIYFCDFGNLPQKIKGSVNNRLIELSSSNSSSANIHPPYTFLCQAMTSKLLSDELSVSNLKTMKDYVNNEFLIANFLSLFASNHAPCVELRWCILEDTTPLSGIIDQQETQYIEVVKPKHYDSWNDIDAKQITHLFRKYLSMNEVLRLPLDISLARLCQAMNTWNNTNKAIDLGIALESVLTKPDTNGELTLQIKIIGSKLASNELEKRKEIASLLSTAYSIRSSAVHDGILKELYKVNGRGKLKPSIIMEETFPILRRCLVKIIEQSGLTKEDYEELFFS